MALRPQTSSSTEQPPSRTKEQPSETSIPAPDQTPSPNKAVSIIMRNVYDNGDNCNSRTFFETSVGSQADGCEDPALDGEATR
jgi:hypothetical protein